MLFSKRAKKSDSLFRSFQKERQRANRSFALLKRAQKSESLFRSFKKSAKERIALLLFSKRAKERKKSESLFFYFFALFKERITLFSLFLKRKLNINRPKFTIFCQYLVLWCSVTLLKRATKRDCSFALYKKSDKEQFALLLF